MGKRLGTDRRLLTALFVTLVVSSAANAFGTSTSGDLYIRARSAGCSRTKLIITLSGVEQQPKSILLSIRNDKTGAVEVESASVELQDDEYTWIGLIQLGSFTAIVSIPESKTTLEGKFTNIKLLLPFQDSTRPFIQLRGGGNSAADVGAQPQERQQKIPVGSLSSTIDKIHLLLIGTDNKLAAQYLGSPISTWTPTVPDGSYRLVTIEYGRNGSECKVNGKNQ
jgi:hypothetical protein